MKIEKQLYPYNPDVKELPFYLTGIGGSEYQGKVNRTYGYLWHQILYCADGSGILEADGKTYSISKGICFFLPRNYPHSYRPETAKWDIRWIAFDGCLCDDTLKRLEMTEPQVIDCSADNKIEKLFERMITSQENDILYCDFICSGLVYDYILLFHRYVSENTDSRKSRNASLVYPALRYINENFRDDISLTQLSEIADITPQHFCRVFKKTMGMTPIEYLTEIRLEEAKRLMSDSTVSVSMAAERSGFRDAGYFSTVFRKNEGISPREYLRKLYNE